TPNTPAYTKGKHVYALNIARRAAAAEGALIVVEGYLDALALHQAGFANAVASLGTAFTPEQARELRRVAPNLYLCFDGDAAGVAATSRSIDMLGEEGLKVEVVALPAGTDPDDLLRERGAEAFSALLQASVPWKDFKLDAAFARSEKKFAAKSDIAKEMMAVAALERDPIVRDQYVKSISRRLGVSESALRKVDYAASTPIASRGDDSPARSSGRRGPQVLSAERELIQLLFARPAFIAVAAEHVPEDDFTDVGLAHAYAVLLERRADVEGGLNPLTLFSDDPMSDEFARLALATPPLSIDEDRRRLERVLARFDRMRMERRLSNLDAQINSLLTEGASVPERLREEHNTLAASLHGTNRSGKEG
ncbi:MAG TPA: toprim domain-containing protein, partial [Candidatus Eremiobacteraceae bacterium]|nr:toprim domain-containing protein [Candidatus Eremiobacteraceae bacterium]